MLDSTTVWAHQYATGAQKRGAASADAAVPECLGRSCGGLTTKVHASCDALGNPLRLLLTWGHRNDIMQAEALLDSYDAGAVLADRGYDADWLAGQIAVSRSVIIIPSKSNRLVSRCHDASLYADRNKASVSSTA